MAAKRPLTERERRAILALMGRDSTLRQELRQKVSRRAKALYASRGRSGVV